MTNLTIIEKRALEEVFLVLESRKKKKLTLLRKYILFYKFRKMFFAIKR